MGMTNPQRYSNLYRVIQKVNGFSYVLNEREKEIRANERLLSVQRQNQQNEVRVFVVLVFTSTETCSLLLLDSDSL